MMMDDRFRSYHAAMTATMAADAVRHLRMLGEDEAGTVAAPSSRWAMAR